MSTRAKPPIWSPRFALSLLSTFSFFGSFFYLISVLPDYVDEIGGAEWQVGLIVGGFALVPMFLRPFVGRWSDGGRRLPLMRIGLLTFALSFALMVISADVISLFFIRLVQGVGMAAFPTAAASLVAEIVPASRRGEGLGLFGMASSAAQMVAPAVGVVVADQWGFDAVFAVSAATAGLTLLLVAPMREPAAHPMPAGGGQLLPRRALFPSVLFMSVTVGFSAAAGFLPLLSDERDLGNAGLFFLVSGAMSVIVRPLGGRTSDRYGRLTIIVPGLAATAAGMWLLAQAETQAAMLIAGAFAGLGLGAAHTGLFALSIDRVAATQRGGATAVFQLAWDVGFFVGGVVLGIVASAIAVESVFWAAGMVAVAAIGLLLVGRTQGWTQTAERPELEPAAAPGGG